MSGLFGTPVGFIAAGEEQRANVDSTLKALKTIGEIAQQPVDADYKRGLTRLHYAEAGAKEAEAADARAMAALEAQFHAQGKNPTVEELNAAPRRPRSQAEQIMAMAEFAESKGAPVRFTGKLRDTAAEILQKEATAGWRDAEVARAAQQTLQAKQTRISNAAAAAAESPQAYMTVLQDPELSQLLPVKQLSGDWNTDRQVLDTIAKAGQDSIRRARLSRQATEIELNTQRTAASVARAEAARDLAKARKVEVEDRAARAIKNGGERSPEAADAKRAATDARRAATEAKFPGIESTPHPLLIGKNRTLPTGERVTIVGINPNGTYRLQKYTGLAAAREED